MHRPTSARVSLATLPAVIAKHNEPRMNLEIKKKYYTLIIFIRASVSLFYLVSLRFGRSWHWVVTGAVLATFFFISDQRHPLNLLGRLVAFFKCGLRRQPQKNCGKVTVLCAQGAQIEEGQKVALRPKGKS